jgi:chemotaxis signal transduction protein
MSTDMRQAALLTQLQVDFDRSFSQPARPGATDLVEFLGFSTGNGCYAAQLNQVAAVREIRALTRVPGKRSGFEGLVATQGQLVAVYDLAVLIAAPASATMRRWLLVYHDDHQVGFAVDAVDCYLQIPRARIVSAKDPEHQNAIVSKAIDEGPTARLVVNLDAVLASIRRSVSQDGQCAP